jgi:hypothetical protein
MAVVTAIEAGSGTAGGNAQGGGVVMALAFLALPTGRLRRAFGDDVREALNGTAPALPPITNADLARLPQAVQRYLRGVGVVGQPPVANFRIRLHGRIRSDADSRWMPLRAEQYTFVRERKRFFYLTSSMLGVPVQGYHRYADGSASMNIRAASLLPIVKLTGAEMHQSETVTFLNDMCLFAPATLLDPDLIWEECDGSVRVRFTNAGIAVGAELFFDNDGRLIDFVSEDRYQASSGGRRMTRLRWSTPVAAYRSFGPLWLWSSGEARWHAANGSFAYAEMELDDVDYNVRAR